MDAQGPSHVENNRGKGRDVPGAVACAKRHDGEGAPAAPPGGACAGKELIWWEGPCRAELIERAVHLLSAHLSRARRLSGDAPITNYENPHAAEHAEPQITSSSFIARGYF